jgi:hypothetical protein
VRRARHQAGFRICDQGRGSLATHNHLRPGTKYLMTNRHHQTAAAHCTSPEAPRRGTANVVDLVTMSMNLKTEDLKTVIPKRETVFAPLPHFRCNFESSISNPEPGLVVARGCRILNADGNPVVEFVTSGKYQKTKALETVPLENKTVSPLVAPKMGQPASVANCLLPVAWPRELP